MPKSKTRSIEMYVGRVEPQDWYLIDVDIPAGTPEDKIAEAAGEALTRILDRGKVRAAFWGVYRTPARSGARNAFRNCRTRRGGHA